MVETVCENNKNYCLSYAKEQTRYKTKVKKKKFTLILSNKAFVSVTVIGDEMEPEPVLVADDGYRNICSRQPMGKNVF